MGPLRKVLLHDTAGRHVLECGHSRWFRHTTYGPTKTQKSARCQSCYRGEPAYFNEAELSAAAKAGTAGKIWHGADLGTLKAWLGGSMEIQDEDSDA